ncbi:hypothetical protein NPIL_165861 [Nephila pilipes]|uniref:Uncharacterized protein n=1 Tax=Nephila pilipes TaxID=299642 RepID=A0A8X6R1H5_NEPPI|nr:hypothetical protein NPIL_165861 [Nephila pilipes]
MSKTHENGEAERVESPTKQHGVEANAAQEHFFSYWGKTFTLLNFVPELSIHYTPDFRTPVENHQKKFNLKSLFNIRLLKKN